MRDKNLNLIQFHKEVEYFLKRNLRIPSSLRTAVVTSTTFLGEDYFLVYPRKFRELQVLCIVQWYLPEFLHWKILMDLSEKEFKQFPLKQRLELKLLLHSKELALFYLWDTKRYTANEIFGNLLKQANRILLPLKPIRRNYRIIYPQRKRGYDDKGSLRRQGTWLPDKDWTLDLLQKRKDRDYITLLRAIDRIHKYYETLQG